MARPGLLPAPDLSLERNFAAHYGVAFVAGVDEAGRGALAGPVYAAAVVLPLDNDALTATLHEVRDSKLLPPPTRERLFDVICACILSYGIGSASAEEIDRFGILAATRIAMTAAVGALSPAAQAVLVDGPLRLVGGKLPQQPIIRGDRLSLSIAAASILAKVSRDRYVTEVMDKAYPQYQFARHKGYGTRLHYEMLDAYGPCPEHRRSFLKKWEEKR